MAQSGDIVKAKIERKIFNSPPATSIQITPITRAEAGSYGGYGGLTDTAGTPVATIGVPYGYLTGDRAYFSFGLTQEGETKVAVKESEVVEEDYEITFTGANLPSYITDKTFVVKKIQDYPYNNYNLARILTIKEIVSSSTQNLNLVDSNSDQLLDANSDTLQVTS